MFVLPVFVVAEAISTETDISFCKEIGQKNGFHAFKQPKFVHISSLE